MSWLAIGILTAVCALTYTFEIVFGLGGTIMMLPLLSGLFDAKTLVIYSVLPQILVGSIGLWRSPRTVAPRYVGKMLLFACAGGVLGIYLFYFFSAQAFHYLLAGAITIFGVYLIAAPGRLRLPHWAARVLDTLAGASQALFGISGPIAMTRLMASFPDKTVVRNYALAFFLCLNVFRLGAYIIQDSLTRDVLWMMAVSGPVLAVVLWYGNHLHFKVREQMFRRVVAWIILIGGVSLFLR